jgi:hypothetical protein
MPARFVIGAQAAFVELAFRRVPSKVLLDGACAALSALLGRIVDEVGTSSYLMHEVVLPSGRGRAISCTRSSYLAHQVALPSAPDRPT